MKKHTLGFTLALIAALAVTLMLASCDTGGEPLGQTYAKGGAKGAPEIVIDSVTVIPRDTTVAPGDSVQFHALLWIEGQPYIHCPEYGVAIPFTGDRTECDRYVPKGKGRYKT
jgi:hypothetical protein